MTVVTEAVLGRMAGTVHPRGPLAVVRRPEPSRLRPVDTVVLWDVADPGNAGAIVRSAAALGFDVAVTSGAGDVWSPKAVRAAAATQFRTRVTDLGDDPMRRDTRLRSHRPGGGDLGRAPTSAPLPGAGPVAVLVGSEAHGLPDDVVAAAIPVSLRLDAGVESLNVAVAAGILMHERRRNR